MRACIIIISDAHARSHTRLYYYTRYVIARSWAVMHCRRQTASAPVCPHLLVRLLS